MRYFEVLCHKSDFFSNSKFTNTIFVLVSIVNVSHHSLSVMHLKLEPPRGVLSEAPGGPMQSVFHPQDFRVLALSSLPLATERPTAGGKQQRGPLVRDSASEMEDPGSLPTFLFLNLMELLVCRPSRRGGWALFLAHFGMQSRAE